MNKKPEANAREENVFNVEMTLDASRVSRFLVAECEGGVLADDVDSERKKPVETKPPTLTMQRPLFYQRPNDLRCIALPNENRLELNVKGVKPAKYVSEMHVKLTAPPKLEDAVKYSTPIPPIQSQKVPKPVEYISGIQVTHSTFGNTEGSYPTGGLITRIRKERSAALISNFLTKRIREPATSLKSLPPKHSEKQIVYENINVNAAPSTQISLLIPSNEDSISTRTTGFASTEVSSKVFTTMTATTDQTLYMSEYTEATEFLKHTMETNGKTPQRNASFITLTNQASSTPALSIDKMIEQKQDSSSSERCTGTLLPEASYLSTDDDDVPPPLPDQPPPLPNQPPPSLSNFGPMITSITPEEVDFITDYLKSFKPGRMEYTKDASIVAFPKSIQPLRKDSYYSNHQSVKTEHSTKHVSTTTKISTSVVSQQLPKITRSINLPVWPPPPRTDSPPSRTFVSSDSSSGESQWEDLERREQAGRVVDDKTPGEASLGKNGRTVASWDTGYWESNTSSLISWSPPDQPTHLGLQPDDEGPQEIFDDDKEAEPQRPSVLELLRNNSDAGRKTKPRWNNSVDSDVLGGLSEKKLQLLELEFEIITTEAEYFSRVEFLKKNFLVSNVRYKKESLNSDSKKNIFLDLDEVCCCSEKLLADLDKCWKKSVYLKGIYDVVKEHCKANVSAFINYCAEYEGVVEKIAVLRKEDRKFEELVSCLEKGKPDLSEQFRAPMNRIIQLNLLLKNCQDVMTHLSKTEYSDVFTIEYDSCRSAAESVAQLCAKVDEVTGMRRRVQKIMEIQESLEFPLQMTQLSLASQNRWLVKKGALTQNGYLILNTEKKHTFKRSSSVLTIFLFNDLIILTKKKSEECHVVKDYGQRPGIQLSLTRGMEELPRRLVEDSPGYYTLFLSIAKNHMGGTAHVFLSCTAASERDDWLDAMTRTSDEYHGL